MAYREDLQKLVARYRAEGNPWPADNRSLAAWMIAHRHWEPELKSSVDLLAPQISRALREEYVTDPQGRRIRRNHAIREVKEMADGRHEQMTFWVSLDTATPEQMQTAFQQRRHQILGDCRQLKTDVDSYNDNNQDGAMVQMVFDFTEDLEELEMSDEYAEFSQSR